MQNGVDPKKNVNQERLLSAIDRPKVKIKTKSAKMDIDEAHR